MQVIKKNVDTDFKNGFVERLTSFTPFMLLQWFALQLEIIGLIQSDTRT